MLHEKFKFEIEGD